MKCQYQIIDGYNLKIAQSIEGEGWDISIMFRHDKEDYISSMTYEDVPNEIVNLVEKKLFDDITYNNECKGTCQTISYMTIMHEVDEIIKSRRKSVA